MSSHRHPRSLGAAAATGSQFRRVMVCLDRSVVSEAVLPLASYLAQINDAKLTLVHVLDEPPGHGDVVHATDALEWEIIRQETRAYLNELVERAREYGVDAEGRVAEGSAAHRVSELATSIGADLLVLSTHGEGQTGEWDLGGTAHKILTLARIPVLVVPSRMDEPAAHIPPQRILVPLDGSVRSECVLPTAINIARAANAEIIAAHVVPDPVRTEVLFAEEDIAIARAFVENLTARAGEYLARIQAQLEASGVTATTIVARSVDSREELVAVAAAQGADLIVLSAHGATCNPRHHYGSVATHVMAHSPIPVLVVQDIDDTTSIDVTGRTSRLPPRSVDAAVAQG